LSNIGNLEYIKNKINTIIPSLSFEPTSVKILKYRITMKFFNNDLCTYQRDAPGGGGGVTLGLLTWISSPTMEHLTWLFKRGGDAYNILMK